MRKMFWEYARVPKGIGPNRRRAPGGGGSRGDINTVGADVGVGEIFGCSGLLESKSGEDVMNGFFVTFKVYA